LTGTTFLPFDKNSKAKSMPNMQKTVIVILDRLAESECHEYHSVKQGQTFFEADSETGTQVHAVRQFRQNHKLQVRMTVEALSKQF
jgi:hypothetical protein